MKICPEIRIRKGLKKKITGLPRSAIERIVSTSMSAASLGLKMTDGRVKGLLVGSASLCIEDLIACN